jgi:hypothetical protein
MNYTFLYLSKTHQLPYSRVRKHLSWATSLNWELVLNDKQLLTVKNNHPVKLNYYDIYEDKYINYLKEIYEQIL